MFTQQNVIIGVIAFLIGGAIGATAQNWRGDAQNAEDRETYHLQVISAQNAIKAELERSAEKAAAIVNYSGEKDNEAAKKITELEKLNANLVRRIGTLDRLRKRAELSGGQSCAVASATVASDSDIARSATGMSAELHGVPVAVVGTELTAIYALEADILRVRLDACGNVYNKARDESNKQ